MIDDSVVGLVEEHVDSGGSRFSACDCRTTSSSGC